MKLPVTACLLALALVVGGCASGVSRAPGISSSSAQITSAHPLASVSVTLTDEAREKVTDNLKFNADELLSHVKRALDANALLKANGAEPMPTLEVRVKDVRVRSSFTAIMFGFMAGADSIAADILVKSPAGKELDKFEVSTSYALGGLGGGQDSTRMSWLYEKFAEETLKELKKQ